MLISELIAELEKLKVENGDTKAVMYDGDGWYHTFDCFIERIFDDDNFDEGEKVIAFY